MSELATQYAELERHLQRAIREHLRYGCVRGNYGFGGVAYHSLAPEPVEHQWQRIVDAVPDSPAERAWRLQRLRRELVRYGCRRLRAGHEWSWQRPLTVVRAETAAALRQLGHAELARGIAMEPARTSSGAE
jgi:hypothetical protein